MTEKTKITLSAKELELVCNKEWILTKQVVIDKVYQLFGTLSMAMQQYIQERGNQLPVQATATSPKISRGENYRQLPYVMLDYPRHFTKGESLAIRIFFWWGNFFSISLQLEGEMKKSVSPALLANFLKMQQQDYWLCIHTDPWEHHFGEDNYRPMKQMTKTEFAAILNRELFVKISKQIPVQQWDAVPEFLELHFIELMEINFPTGEKGLSPGIPTTGFDL